MLVPLTFTNEQLQIVFDDVALQCYADTISALDLSRDTGLGEVEHQQRAQHILLRVAPWEAIVKKAVHIYGQWAKDVPYSLPRPCQAALEQHLDLLALQFFAGCSENNYPRHTSTPWNLREACFSDVLIPNPSSRWSRVWIKYQQLSSQEQLFKNALCEIWGPTPL